MNASMLDDVVKQLVDEKAKSVARANQLRNALTIAEDQVARIDGAIATLQGKSYAVASGTTTRKPSVKRKAAARAANRDQVAELLTATLRQHGVMKEEKLKVAVENQLVAAGFSRMGYALRFNEALADARFVSVEDGITLRRRVAVTAQPAEAQVANIVPLQNGNPSHPQKTLYT